MKQERKKNSSLAAVYSYFNGIRKVVKNEAKKKIKLVLYILKYFLSELSRSFYWSFKINFIIKSGIEIGFLKFKVLKLKN